MYACHQCVTLCTQRADIGDSATAIRAAQQMLAELLDVPSLSPRVVSGLQQVSGLLRLAEGRQSQPPKSKVSVLISVE